MVKIAIYADGADLKTMASLLDRDDIAGATTNPSLMRKAGITDYRSFAREVLAVSRGKPVSFEVFEPHDAWRMTDQAVEIASWGENVMVKIPVIDVNGDPTDKVVSALTERGIKVNVTAVFTAAQAKSAAEAMRSPGSIISVFAGRICDAGVNPTNVVTSSAMFARRAGAKVLWASARQVYSVIEAERALADIITLTPDLIEKLPGLGRDLDAFSLDTVRQFAKDAEGITL